MGSPIAETWVYATVLVTNEWHRSGTGFLVQREVEQGRYKVFVVTNKHVLNEDNTRRQNARYVQLTMNVSGEDGKPTRTDFAVDMQNPLGARWKEHRDPDVDVLAVDVTDVFVNNPKIVAKRAGYDVFADAVVLEEHDITIGDEIIVIGYPLGMTQGATSFPILRQGIIASKIGERFHQRRQDGTTVPLPAFLVDCGLVPGSSGSPVILKPATGRFVKGNVLLGSAPTYLLGIVANTQIASVMSGGEEFQALSGLGLAFDASTVRETVEAFLA